MKQGWVYSGVLGAEELRQLIESIPGRVLLSWGLARLDFPNVLELRDAGCAFNHEAEIRWEKAAEGRYRVWVLSDSGRNDLPDALRLVEGNWEISECTTRLLNLEDRRFAPQFAFYPVVNAPEARLKCQVFYRDKVATFVSPREVESDAQESER
ncbi:MAG: hypothetical protein QN200_06185 [Armatimonadota bacterium]|nr:hypothetical protein [Armatimonadota bacterium]MDR7614896.1 hypothetical protein [Armatimonadota bacterium]